MAAGHSKGQAGGASAQVVQHLAAEVSGLRQQVHATARTVAGLEQNDARRAREEAERDSSKNDKGLKEIVTKVLKR